MNKIYKKAYAKINLNLNVLWKREDWYHNIESVIQIIDLYDEIFIEKISWDDIELFCDSSLLNEPESNIIYKAYLKLKESYKNISWVKVTLLKNIPIWAWLWWWSADCASFLFAMNELCDLKIPFNELLELWASLGADVPACMHTGLVFVEGKWEKITKISQNLDYSFLIIKPKKSFSTKFMFERIAKNKKVLFQKNNNNKIIDNIRKKDIKSLSEDLYNVFEDLITKDDEIFDIKKILKEEGALNSLMTWTWPSVFWIFDDYLIAKKVYKKLKNKFEIYLTKAIDD